MEISQIQFINVFQSLDFTESVKKISVNRYERNKKARQKCLSHYGYNCHSIIHLSTPAFTVEELKQLIQHNHADNSKQA